MSAAVVTVAQDGRQIVDCDSGFLRRSVNVEKTEMGFLVASRRRGWRVEQFVNIGGGRSVFIGQEQIGEDKLRLRVLIRADAHDARQGRIAGLRHDDRIVRRNVLRQTEVVFDLSVGERAGLYVDVCIRRVRIGAHVANHGVRRVGLVSDAEVDDGDAAENAVSFHGGIESLLKRRRAFKRGQTVIGKIVQIGFIDAFDRQQSAGVLRLELRKRSDVAR